MFNFILDLPLKTKIKNENADVYFQLCFIIGSQKGIPSLLLINDECVIKLSESNSTKLSNPDSIKNSLDTIYMIYYAIDDKINTRHNLYNESYRSTNANKIQEENIKLYERLIDYKKDYWLKKEYNLIELIKESIQYPAFFGLCSGYDNTKILVHGSVMIALNIDEKSKDTIASNLNQAAKTQSMSINKHYGAFTIFAQLLYDFLNNVNDYIKSKDSSKLGNIDDLCNSLFASIPPINDVLFDLLVDLIHKIITKNIVSAEYQKKFKKYLFLTVKNYENLGFKDTFGGQAFRDVFKPLNRERISVGTALQLFEHIEVPDILLSTKIKLADGYTPKFPKIDQYIKHLSATYSQPNIIL